MILEGSGVQVPNACYAECLGFPTVGPWFCEDDGLTDGEEVAEGADANNQDTDGDGLSDGLEVGVFDTDPTNADTDGNGLSDALDIAAQLAGPPAPPLCEGDVNADGSVSVSDILQLLGQFGNTCE